MIDPAFPHQTIDHSPNDPGNRKKPKRNPRRNSLIYFFFYFIFFLRHTNRQFRAEPAGTSERTLIASASTWVSLPIHQVVPLGLTAHSAREQNNASRTPSQNGSRTDWLKSGLFVASRIASLCLCFHAWPL